MTAATDPLDFLDLDRLLDEEERLIRDTTRGFVADKLLPEIAGWFERGHFPRELAKELGGLGLLGMHLHGYGCAGTNAVSYGLACLELEAGDSGFRSFVSVQGSLAMFPIWKYGSEEQKRRWLPPMAAGEVVGCFGLTEPDFGSNPAGMRTSARRDGGEVTSELVLDDCRLPDDAVLPQVSGMRGPLSCLDEARYGIVWGSMGAARACFASALQYATTRVQFDRPIGGFQLTQQKLADMLVELSKGTLLALHLGRMKDQGLLTPQQTSLGKLNNVREALQIARSARTILGANGVTLEYPVIRHANNLESVLTYEGTSEVHSLILGQALTGLNAFQ